MNGREIIARRCTLGNGAAGDYLADAILSDLTAAGFRLLEPGQIDKETLHRCENECSRITGNPKDFNSEVRKGAGMCVAAIRSLGDGQ